MNFQYGNQYRLHLLETPEEMRAVEDMQRIVWPGTETEIVPSHILLTIVHNGGIAIGAYFVQKALISQPDEYALISEDLPADSPMIGFVYGFPGFYQTDSGTKIKHCSHQMGVHPNHRNKGIGFALKRAQWQMVRHQGLDRITWTYDPLQSRNAYLNITKLGVVCNTYLRDVYGPLQDGLNVGLPTDRFQVDWWVNSQRVAHRIGRNARLKLDLAHFVSAGAEIINPTHTDEYGLPKCDFSNFEYTTEKIINRSEKPSLLLAEIPSNILEIKEKNQELAQNWRIYTRDVFEFLFKSGYLVTDFVFLPGKYPRSFYVLSYGESTF